MYNKFKGIYEELNVDTECNHDPNSPMNSLITTKKRTMVCPERFDFVCSKCGKSFSFIRVNGRYTRQIE